MILSYFIAFSILCIFISFAVGLCVYVVSPHLFSYAHLVWIFSVAVENIIMVSVSLFFSMYISSAASAAMVTLGFYALARMMGQLIGIIDSPMVDSGGGLAMALQLVSVVTPRLDLLGQSSWLLYGLSHDGFGLLQILLQGIVFCALVLCAACYDFSRRAF